MPLWPQVFSTSPSQELFLAADACKLDAHATIALAEAPLHHAFDPTAVASLRAEWGERTRDALARLNGSAS